MLKIKKLVAGYGKIIIFNGLDFEINENIGVVGPNGAGKSTLAKIIAGLLKPISGKILFKKEDITDLGPEQRVAKGLLVIPERGGFFRTLTVEENLRISIPTNLSENEVKERLEEVFNLFPRIKERLAQKAGTLSGGEQRMLALARAFLRRPDLLVLDEPSVGLAPKVKEELVDAINNLKKLGVKVLIEEQDPYIAYYVADNMYIMYSGIIKMAEKEDIIKRYVEFVTES